MWMCIFWIGLIPEITFNILRNFSGVVTQKAIVNSPSMISVSFALYMAIFVYRICRDNGLDHEGAQSKGIQMGLMALIAFFEMPYTGRLDPSLMELLVRINEISIPSSELRNLIIVVAVTKLAVWCYLFSLMMRYYVFGNHLVFNSMFSVFPGAAKKETPDSGDDGDNEEEIDVADHQESE